MVDFRYQISTNPLLSAQIKERKKEAILDLIRSPPLGFTGGGQGRSGCGQLDGDELLEPLQVLGVELDVVVPGALHPQGLHGTRAALVHCQAVREVDHLILRAVDHQHRRRHLGHLVDAGEREGVTVYQCFNKARAHAAERKTEQGEKTERTGREQGEKGEKEEREREKRERVGKTNTLRQMDLLGGISSCIHLSCSGAVTAGVERPTPHSTLPNH